MSTATYTVSGMTCAHCVSAVTEEVSAVPGVTEVQVDLETGALTVTVEKTGYTAALPQPEPEQADEGSGLRTRLVVSAALSVPVVLIGMIPALHFAGWQWVSLVLATPVVVWGGSPFHRATWTN